MFWVNCGWGVGQFLRALLLIVSPQLQQSGGYYLVLLFKGKAFEIKIYLPVTVTQIFSALADKTAAELKEVETASDEKR